MKLNKNDTSNGLLRSLLDDLEIINSQHNTNIELHQVDKHTEWSPERTDPCPDYYGMYYLYIPEPKETIGACMYVANLNEIMNVLSGCT